jgi:transposase-like protein
LDALIVKIRDGHAVRNQACYVAIGVNLDGERDVLGLWFQATEGAKFWLHVLTDLKHRGVADILFVCVDGLTGFVEAIEAAFPATTVQACLVHQVRSSLRFVSYKDRKTLASDQPQTCARSTPPSTPSTPATSSRRLAASLDLREQLRVRQRFTFVAVALRP